MAVPSPSRLHQSPPDRPTVRSPGVRFQLADEIDGELHAAGTSERAAHERAYLKSELVHYGASVPAIRSVATRVAKQHPGLGHDTLVDLVEALWIEPVHERRMVAVELLELYVDRLRPDDAELLEHLLCESRTWALVDGLAASVVGRLVERYDEMGTVLDRWAGDDDFWLRRSALLAFLVPLRRGDGEFSRFSRYADAMLDDHEFFVRKAIGWVLRDTAEAPGPRVRLAASTCRSSLVADDPRGDQADVRTATHGDSRRPTMRWLRSLNLVGVESVVEEGGDASLPLVGMSVEGAGMSGVRNDPHVDGFG